MKYRDILGFSKPKKKVIKEQFKPKPKKNKIIENVKQELNEWYHAPPKEKRWSKTFNGNNGLTEFEANGGKDVIKEVGAGPEYKPHIDKIAKLYHAYWDSVKDFTDLLHKKGLKKEGNDLHRMYMKTVHKFNGYFAKFIRKIF